MSGRVAGKTNYLRLPDEMPTTMQQNKIEAIYALRDAAELKAVAEVTAARHPSANSRDALLAAQMRLESSTQDAIEACHECGHAHDAAQAHPSASRGNVIEMDFGSAKKRPG